MNINDLPQGSYKVISGGNPPTGKTPTSGLNIKNLPAGSYKPVSSTGFPSEAPPSVHQSFMSKLGGAINGTADFLGTKIAGQGIATAINTATGGGNAAGNNIAQDIPQFNKLIQTLHSLPQGDPRRQSLLNALRNNQNAASSAPTQAEIDPGTALSNKQVIGSFGNVAGDVLAGSSGLSNAGKLGGVASKINSVVQPLSSATKLGRFGNAGIAGLGLGAVQGATQAMNDNKSGGDIAKQSLSSGLIGGGLSIGAQGLSELLKAASSKQVTSGIVDKTIGTPKNVIKAGKSPAGDIVTAGVPRTKVGLLNQADKQITTSSEQIRKILPSVNQTHDTSAILNNINHSLSSTYGGALNQNDIKAIIENLPVAALRDNKNIDTVTLNKLREVIDNKYIGNGKWLNSASATPERVTALKAAANTMREIVQGSHPELKGLFQQYSKGITQKTILSNELAKPHVLTNIIEALSAAGIGLGTGGISPEGAIKGLAGYGAIKTLLSTPTQTGLAIGLDRAGKLPASAVGKGIKSVGRLATQRVIQANQK